MIVSLKYFIDAHQINTTDNLQIVFINAHGGIFNDVHKIQAFEVKGDDIDEILLSTRQCVQNIINDCDLQRPVEIVLASCYGWHAIPDLLEVLPNGSEILALGKYRIENGVESVDSSSLRNYKTLMENLRHYEPKNFDEEGISLKEIALLHSKSLQDLNFKVAPFWWQWLQEGYGGGTLYAKKRMDGTTHQVIFEDQVAHLEDISWTKETVREFIDTMCSDEMCKAELESVMPYILDVELDIKFIKEAFASYIALGGV